MLLRSKVLLIVLALLVCPLGGCARVWPTPQANLPLRHETIREQLVIRSDEPLPQHHRLLDEVTAQRSHLLSLLNLHASDEPIYVYLFASAERFKQFMRSHFPDLPDRRAFFVEKDTRLEVYAHWGDRVAEDLRHEVAHGYLHSVVPQIPLWIDEGLAEYFEVPRGYQGLNLPHVQHLVQRLDAGWQPNIRRLEALSSPLEMDQIDYAESWAWAHFLLRTYPERRDLLRQYLGNLYAHGTAEPISARLYRVSADPNAVLATYVRQLAARHPSGGGKARFALTPR